MEFTDMMADSVHRPFLSLLYGSAPCYAQAHGKLHHAVQGITHDASVVAKKTTADGCILSIQSDHSLCTLTSAGTVRTRVDMSTMEQDEDCVLREIDVYLCNNTGGGAQLCVLGHPLRAPWRPYNYNDVSGMRMKPQTRRLEVDLPLSTSSRNFNREDGGSEASYKHIENLTLRSQQVDQPTALAMGAFHDGKLLLVPIDFTLQMRPTLAHLNVTRKGGGGGEEGAEEGEGGEEEEGGDTTMRAVEVQVQKRETERQQQARLNSYAYLAQKEAEEPWKPLAVHMDDTPVAEMVWERLMAVPDTKPALQHLTKADYLKSFAPSFVNLQADSAAASFDAPTQQGADPLVAPPSLSQLSDACKSAFALRVQALFNKHSVCSMENVRQWVLDPRYVANETQAASAAAARDATLLEDRQLHELMMSHSGLPLACIRRMYVLRQTNKDTDAFRKIVVDLLQEKEGIKKQEVTELAHSQGVTVTDSMYIRVLKDLCINRAQLWQLKPGADL